MLKGTTESGFEYEIDETKLNDMEYVEDLAEMDANILAYPKVIERTLGKEGKRKLYEHVRDENGRVPVDKITQEFTEILNSAGSQTKNS